MDNVADDRANEAPHGEKESELVELGEVSVETRGGNLGSQWDGSWGVRL